MDIEFMKSAAEDQMEMMLMQMDKLPDFSTATYDHHNIPLMDEFTNNNNTVLENPTFMNHHHHHHHPSSTISFSGGVHHEPPSFLQHPPPNTSGGRWQTNEYYDDHSGSGGGAAAQKRHSNMAAMREMIFRIAAMQPIHIDPESVKPPKRRNVKISTDPQSVAARHRRERISERIRILQRLVPGGTKMDTASMLDEAIHYVKFLKNQVQSLERVSANRPSAAAPDGIGFPVPMLSGNYFPAGMNNMKGYRQSSPPNVQMLE
ncbi:hypothetical protein ABFS82_14G255900 [Erythranthe guttata]|uniref:BHLH domain-containing protein n=2 Tax=Erythranthe guttata TaxID=4155 RepID=A0A022R7T1_ERYGU|nr:hypothetical protein MIMGU_mgv1a024545mg [Erythranthe guttata]